MKAFRLALALCLAWTAASAQVVRVPPRPGFKPGITSACAPYTYSGSPYYQSLNLSGWVAGNATYTANTVASPACSQTGGTLVENSSVSTTHSVGAGTTGGTVSAKAYTLTMFAKRNAGSRNIEPQMRNSAQSSFALIDIDLSNCSNHGTFAFGAWSSASGSATLQSNGWCLITLTATTGSDTQMPLQVFMTDAAFSSTYSGNGTSSVDIWGVDVR